MGPRISCKVQGDEGKAGEGGEVLGTCHCDPRYITWKWLALTKMCSTMNFISICFAEFPRSYVSTCSQKNLLTNFQDLSLSSEEFTSHQGEANSALKKI